MLLNAQHSVYYSVSNSENAENKKSTGAVVSGCAASLFYKCKIRR